MIGKRLPGAMNITLGLLGILLLLGLPGIGLAQHNHGGAAAAPGKAGKGVQPRGPVQSVTVEGLKISLEVMPMTEHMKHATQGPSHGASQHSQTHMVMVTLQDIASKEIITDAKVQFGAISASGEKETGKLEWSGDSYGGGFSPKSQGTYQIQLKIESGGMERDAKFTYDAKE
jgi:hypothetical protein